MAYVLDPPQGSICSDLRQLRAERRIPSLGPTPARSGIIGSRTVFWLNYPFFVEFRSSDWHELPGVYVFAKLMNGEGELEPLYIGETNNFATRFPSHEKWASAARLGATQIHAMVVSDEECRKQIERELIDYYDPILNQI